MLILHELSSKQKIVLTLSSAAAAIVVVVILCLYLQPHQYPKELASIDSLSESRPDSALKLLKRLPERSLDGDADRMYYALLRIKVSNNLYEPQKDSTIFRVCDFFENSRDRDKHRESCYYLGKYYVEHNDAPQALKCFQTALNLSDESTPLSFKSKVYSQSGTLFLYQDMYEDALKMYQKSYSCDSILKDTLNMVHGLRDIAQTYKYLGEIDKSISLLQRAYTMCETVECKRIQPTISFVLASLLYEKGDKPSANKIFPKEIEISESLKPPYYCLAVRLYLDANKIDSANACYYRVMNLDNIYSKQTVLSYVLDYYVSKGNANAALPYIKKYMKVSDSLSVSESSEAVSKMQSLYNYNLREKELSKLEIEHGTMKYTFIIIVLLLLFPLLFFIYLDNKRKKKIADYESLCEHLEKMYTDVCSQKQCNNENTSCNQNSEERSLVHVYDIIRLRLDTKEKITDIDWTEIRDTIESVTPGFKDRVYQKYPLSEHDFKICMLIKIGFFNADIAVIMCRQPSTISMSRQKMYRKMTGKDGTAKDFDKYIRSL